MIKVAVIDGVESRQQLVKSYVNAQPQLRCQWVIPTVAEFWKIPDLSLVNVILIYVTDEDAIEILLPQTRKIKNSLPESEIIILSDGRDTQKVLALLRAGVVGYLPLNTPLVQLKEAMVGVKQDGAYIVPYMVRQMLTYFRSRAAVEEVLTIREKEIVQCLVDGMSYKMIAVKVSIRLDTVRYHLRNIYKKLKVNSKSQVVSKVLSGEINL